MRSRFPTESVPTPLLKIGFAVLVILFFLDEFLILAAIFGGPIALFILLSFAGTVWFVRRTDRGRRLRERSAKGARKAVKGTSSRRYSRREDNRK